MIYPINSRSTIAEDAERVGLRLTIHGRRAFAPAPLSKTVPDSFVEPTFSWVLIPPSTPKSKKARDEPGLFAFLAERVGFEPTVGVSPRLISNQVHSTTLPPLRK